MKALTITPNPTADITRLNLTLAKTATVRIDLLDALGQTMITINAGNLNILNQQVDVSNLANGTYYFRVSIDNETALRPVVVQR